jgi:hypothetical protein
MTVRGLQLLRDARVVVYDQLVNPVLLEEVPVEAELVFVGKQAGTHCIGQGEINEVLIGYAWRGIDVVRLKGGDPFVFGRGGEEAEAQGPGFHLKSFPVSVRRWRFRLMRGFRSRTEITRRRSRLSPGMNRSKRTPPSIGPSWRLRLTPW